MCVLCAMVVHLLALYVCYALLDLQSHHPQTSSKQAIFDEVDGLVQSALESELR